MGRDVGGVGGTDGSWVGVGHVGVRDNRGKQGWGGGARGRGGGGEGGGKGEG